MANKKVLTELDVVQQRLKRLNAELEAARLHEEELQMQRTLQTGAHASARIEEDTYAVASRSTNGSRWKAQRIDDLKPLSNHDSGIGLNSDSDSDASLNRSLAAFKDILLEDDSSPYLKTVPTNPNPVAKSSSSMDVPYDDAQIAAERAEAARELAEREAIHYPVRHELIQSYAESGFELSDTPAAPVEPPKFLGRTRSPDELYNPRTMKNGQPAALLAVVDFSNDSTFVRKIEAQGLQMLDIQIVTPTSGRPLTEMIDIDGHISQAATGKLMKPESVIITGVDKLFLMKPDDRYKEITGESLPVEMPQHIKEQKRPLDNDMSTIIKKPPESINEEEWKKLSEEIKSKIWQEKLDQQWQKKLNEDWKKWEREQGTYALIEQIKKIGAPTVIYSAAFASHLSEEQRQKLAHLGVGVHDFALGKIDLLGKMDDSKIKPIPKNLAPDTLIPVERAAFVDAQLPMQERMEAERRANLAALADKAAEKAREVRQQLKQAKQSGNRAEATILSSHSENMKEITELRQKASEALVLALRAKKVAQKFEGEAKAAENLPNDKEAMAKKVEASEKKAKKLRQEAEERRDALGGVDVSELQEQIESKKRSIKAQEKVRAELQCTNNEYQDNRAALKEHAANIRSLNADIYGLEREIRKAEVDSENNNQEERLAIQELLEKADRLSAKAQGSIDDFKASCKKTATNARVKAAEAQRASGLLEKASKWYEVKATYLEKTDAITTEKMESESKAGAVSRPPKPPAEILDMLTNLTTERKALQDQSENMSKWTFGKKAKQVNLAAEAEAIEAQIKSIKQDWASKWRDGDGKEAAQQAAELRDHAKSLATQIAALAEKQVAHNKKQPLDDESYDRMKERFSPKLSRLEKRSPMDHALRLAEEAMQGIL